MYYAHLLPSLIVLLFYYVTQRVLLGRWITEALKQN